MTFGYDISKLSLRKAELGWTDARLASQAGVHASTVKNVLTGKTCKGPTVKRLAEALGVNMSDIVVPAVQEDAA
jgi:lambda repressor-like predicted transcriptional regulator